jgi:RND family efflux transporter MFP subunit
MQIPNLFKKKKFWAILVLILLVLWRVFSGDNKADSVQTEIIKKQDLKQTVLATGQVTSKTDLSLSFNSSGIVSRVNVKVGDKAKQGQVLANLSQQDQVARYTQAQGALAQAKANLQKVVEGASSEEVRVAQVAVDNAKATLENTKAQQANLVANAYKALLNSTLSADPGLGNTTTITLTVSGAYNSTGQGQYKIGIYQTVGGIKFQYSGLETGSGIISTSPQPLGTRGLYLSFSSTTGLGENDSWTIDIPNTQASTYVANYNAYQAALQTQSSAITTAENTLASAQANLDLKKAMARPADLQAAEAQVLSAQGQVQAASAALENTIIRAPAEGTITLVDIKPGELATALKQVIVLQDVENLHIEANISEANIAAVRNNQSVEVTFDALGVDRKFNAKVQGVDPASTLVSGVVNYKVTISLEKLEEVKPGMTANISILTGEKSGVLAAPLRAIINQDGKKYIRVVTDPKKKTYEQKEVSTGMEGDGGLIEVVSGLEEGKEVVTFIKKK